MRSCLFVLLFACGSTANTPTSPNSREPSRAMPSIATDGDSDDDSISDSADACSSLPEDFDGYQDQDGCAEPDNDLDGILDQNDMCPNEPEDRDGQEDEDGCPDPDNDLDGLLDVDDLCPNDSETRNGVEDQDGCPDHAPQR